MEMGKKKHFVLVHGVCFGSWCWYKVVAQLQSQGCKVTAIDMAASGINPKSVEVINSLYDYSEPLIEFMESLPAEERVILVGHSMGGVCISIAMEKFPQRIAVAVFMAAGMPGPDITMQLQIMDQLKHEQQNSSKKGAQGDEDDAFEALFRQLEEDLKNDDLSVEDDDDITEEDLVMLERELEEALKDDELLGTLGLLGDAKTEDEPEEEEEEGENGNDDYTANHDVQDLEEEDEEEEMPVKLKNWKLKRLAYALKSGRRRTSITNLAADLCLDRAVVLELLRDPPPNLLMLSATLPEKPVSKILEPVNELTETVPLEMTSVALKPEAEVKLPVHVMQSNWSAKKRIKKAQLDTLELVYRRSKRPTNAMISSIVHLTNLPRKKVLKWFEDKRAAEGVPAHRLPYQRSDSVFT